MGSGKRREKIIGVESIFGYWYLYTHIHNNKDNKNWVMSTGHGKNWHLQQVQIPWCHEKRGRRTRMWMIHHHWQWQLVNHSKWKTPPPPLCLIISFWMTWSLSEYGIGSGMWSSTHALLFGLTLSSWVKNMTKRVEDWSGCCGWGGAGRCLGWWCWCSLGEFSVGGVRRGRLRAGIPNTALKQWWGRSSFGKNSSFSKHLLSI